MKGATIRWWLLVEDKQQERFALGLAQLLPLRRDPLQTFVAPSGRGSAEHWVRANYPELVRTKIRKRPSENVALLVLVDGDNLGPAHRLVSLDEALRTANEPVRGSQEPITILVPTWSIETWLLPRDASVDEQTSYKRVVTALEREQVQRAAERLMHAPEPELLPSMRLARTELNRLQTR